MFPKEARNRQEMLKNLILELAEKLLENKDMTERYLNRLNKIYEDGFRHRYSDFFPIIITIRNPENTYDNEYLLNNLASLDLYLEELQSSGDARYKDYENMHHPFVKLIDHLNLQISQGTYSYVNEQRAQQMSAQLEKSNKAVEKANKSIKKSNKQADKMQAQMIAILGIFAAILLAFSGGLTVLGSSIASIGKAEYPESIIVAMLICGIMIFDSLSYLMYMISRIIDRNILIGCKAKSCSECEDNEKCRWMTKVKKRFPYLFYFNVLAGLGIVIVVAVWYLDIRGIVR